MDYKSYNKFEVARLIGARALQIEMGAPPLVEIEEKDIKPFEIARMEFENDILPITVKR